MTPEEKAKELYNQFLPIVRQSNLYETYHNKAKMSVYIVCDEALKLCNIMDGGYSFEKEIVFWNKVKQETSAI